MVLEVRIYRIAPGRRDEFADFYDRLALPAQDEAGLEVLGQFVDLDDPDTFVWLRRFDSVEERNRAWEDFYSSRVWVEELAPIADELIVDTSRSLLVEPTPGSRLR
jgi:hypothetical protein